MYTIYDFTRILYSFYISLCRFVELRNCSAYPTSKCCFSALFHSFILLLSFLPFIFPLFRCISLCNSNRFSTIFYTFSCFSVNFRSFISTLPSCCSSPSFPSAGYHIHSVTFLYRFVMFRTFLDSSVYLFCCFFVHFCSCFIFSYALYPQTALEVTILLVRTSSYHTLLFIVSIFLFRSFIIAFVPHHHMTLEITCFSFVAFRTAPFFPPL